METPTPSPAAPSEPPTSRSAPWTLPVVLAVALAICGALLVKFRQSPQNRESAPNADLAEATVNWTPVAGPQSKTVSLTIDFGNGARREFAALPWTQGMTVADLMQAAARHRPGIAYTQQGAGEMTFLTSLDDVKGGDPAGRFWLYEINGKAAEVSFVVQPLSAGDRVLWAFKSPE